MAKDHRFGGKQQHGKSRERYFARRRALGAPERRTRGNTANGQAKKSR